MNDSLSQLGISSIIDVKIVLMFFFIKVGGGNKIAPPPAVTLRAGKIITLHMNQLISSRS